MLREDRGGRVAERQGEAARLEFRSKGEGDGGVVAFGEQRRNSRVAKASSFLKILLDGNRINFLKYISYYIIKLGKSQEY